MPASPNKLNYSVLKGKVFFTPEGGAERALGNAPVFQVEPEVEWLDHFSSMAGVRAKDRRVALEKTLTCNITLDEITADNLRLALLGGPVAPITGGGGNGFAIFAASEILGAIRFQGENDIGNRVNMTLPNISFGPAGEIDFIAEDDWSQIELQADVLYDEATQSFGDCDVIDTEAVTA